MKRPTVNKADLARIAGAEAGCPMPLAKACITAALTAINRAIQAGQRVELRGFGVFDGKKIPEGRYQSNSKATPATFRKAGIRLRFRASRPD